MRALRVGLTMWLLAAMPAAAAAQVPLTLEEAMQRGRSQTPAARALTAARAEADARVAQARASYFPRIDVSQDVQRGNQPVFVFGSLLGQQRFTAANFAVESLNHPPPLTNLRTTVAAEQSVFDAGRTRLAIRSAALSRELTAATADEATQALALAAAQRFVEVLQAEASARAARAAVDTGDSDLRAARARRDAGLVTDADVLAVEVHVSEARDRLLAADGNVAVARVRLNGAIGAPLDAAFVLSTPMPSSAVPAVDAAVAGALQGHPTLRAAELNVALASTAISTARAAWLPELAVQGGWEFNGGNFSDLRSSWVVGARLQLNVFGGFGDAARLAEAQAAHRRAAAERDGAARAVDVEVRAAVVRLDVARARAASAQAARAQAAETQRIVRDRYDNGLATVSDLLRAAEAVLNADSRAIAAEMDVITQGVALDRAVGRL